MNAIEFLKKFGWDVAKNVIDKSPIQATDFLFDHEFMKADYLKHVPGVSKFSFDLWDGKAWQPFLRHKNRISLIELIRLVDSWDLVNKSLEGLEGAREFVKHREFNIERGLYFKCTLDGIKKNVEKVKQAIADVESVGGDREFKVGDLVVSTWGLEKRVLKIVLKPKFKNGILYLTLLIDGVKRECLAQWWRQATNEEIAMGFRS